MGLTIYYNGKLKSKEALSPLIEELKEIADVHTWTSHIFESEFPNSDFNSEKFDEDIYGILLSPPECEPLCFTFLSNGTMCSPFALQHYRQTKDKSLMEGLFVKTQFAGPQVHRQVVLLMDYISSKYLLNFEVVDETDYWIHRDEKILADKFEEMNRILDFVEDNLKTVKIKPGESLEDYFTNLLINFRGKKAKE